MTVGAVGIRGSQWNGRRPWRARSRSRRCSGAPRSPSRRWAAGRCSDSVARPARVSVRSPRRSSTRRTPVASSAGRGTSTTKWSSAIVRPRRHLRRRSRQPVPLRRFPQRMRRHRRSRARARERARRLARRERAASHSARNDASTRDDAGAREGARAGRADELDHADDGPGRHDDDPPAGCACRLAARQADTADASELPPAAARGQRCVELPGRLNPCLPTRRKISKRASPGSRRGEQPLPSRHAWPPPRPPRARVVRFAGPAPGPARRRGANVVHAPARARSPQAPASRGRSAHPRRRPELVRVLLADRGARRPVARVGVDRDGRRGSAGVARRSVGAAERTRRAGETQSRCARGAPQGLRRSAGTSRRASAGRRGRGSRPARAVAARPCTRRRPARRTWRRARPWHRSRPPRPAPAPAPRRPRRRRPVLPPRRPSAAPRRRLRPRPRSSRPRPRPSSDDTAAASAAPGVHRIEVPVIDARRRRDGYWSERRRRAMGSTAHVVVGDAPDGVVDWAFGELERLEQCWSRFRADSELARLNARTGEWIDVSTSMLLALDVRRRSAPRDRRPLRPDDPRRARARRLRPDLRARRARRAADTPAHRRRAGIRARRDRRRRSRACGSRSARGSISAAWARASPPISSRAASSTAARARALVGMGGDLRARGEPPPDGAWDIPVLDPFDDTSRRVPLPARRRRDRDEHDPHPDVDARGPRATTTSSIPRPATRRRTAVAAVVAAAHDAWWAEGIAKSIVVAGADAGAAARASRRRARVDLPRRRRGCSRPRA